MTSNILNFRDCTLAQLDELFELNHKAKEQTLIGWLNCTAEITDFERQSLLLFQDLLKKNVHDWNEFDLIQNFIGPVFVLVSFSTDKFNLFAERTFSGIVDGVKMMGKPDNMIASGFRKPKKPYFCFQEYKKETAPDKDPAGQVLAAMLVAQEINEYKHPVYGCYVQGRNWFFITLQNKTYSISDGHIATRDDIFDIFRVLKMLKQIITDLCNDYIR
ncbi:MAG: hypothetical protein B6242_13260 [Anaerolineaceae bacterium 4572_78]|nr:MAG: hypothetical protein B6242_13260 [Anaerolineaceae bacterium 4572_78]